VEVKIPIVELSNALMLIKLVSKLEIAAVFVVFNSVVAVVAVVVEPRIDIRIFILIKKF